MRGHMKLTSLLLSCFFGVASLAQGATPNNPANNAVPEIAIPMTKGDEKGSHSYLMINPKSRALDYKQAYDVLRREKTSQRVFFQLAGGGTISNIIDVIIMDNGSIMVFRFNSQQGVKLQAVPVEDVLGVSYTPI